MIVPSPSWGTQKVYQCLWVIFSHNGNASACGRTCEKPKVEKGMIMSNRMCCVRQNGCRVRKQLLYHCASRLHLPTRNSGQTCYTNACLVTRKKITRRNTNRVAPKTDCHSAKRPHEPSQYDFLATSVQ